MTKPDLCYVCIQATESNPYPGGANIRVRIYDDSGLKSDDPQYGLSEYVLDMLIDDPKHVRIYKFDGDELPMRAVTTIYGTRVCARHSKLISIPFNPYNPFGVFK